METSGGLYWAELDEERCPCHGTGWADIEGQLDQCPIHFEGQLHPDTATLLFDEPKRLEEEERKSKLKWKIAEARLKITQLQSQVRSHQENLFKLELELVNRTPTIRGMPAVALSLIKGTTIEVEGLNDE